MPPLCRLGLLRESTYQRPTLVFIRDMRSATTKLWCVAGAQRVRITSCTHHCIHKTSHAIPRRCISADSMYVGLANSKLNHICSQSGDIAGERKICTRTVQRPGLPFWEACIHSILARRQNRQLKPSAWRPGESDRPALRE